MDAAPQKPPERCRQTCCALSRSRQSWSRRMKGAALAALWQAMRAVVGGPPRLGDEAQQAGADDRAVWSALRRRVGAEADLRARSRGPGIGEATARLAVRFIHDNLNRPLPLSEIAAQAHVSPRHLSRLRDATSPGNSPAQYITHARHGPGARPAAAFRSADQRNRGDGRLPRCPPLHARLSPPSSAARRGRCAGIRKSALSQISKSPAIWSKDDQRRVCDIMTARGELPC